MAELTVGIAGRGLDRRLSAALAQEVVDTYEVIFEYTDSQNVTTISRVSWTEGKIAKIIVPYGTYNNDEGPGTGRAYMFAGRVDSANIKTLLAVGQLSKVNGQDGTTIGTGVTDVTFSFAALDTAVSDNVSTSTFKVDPVGSGIVETKTVIDTKNRTIPAFILKPDSAADGNKFSAAFTISINSAYQSIAEKAIVLPTDSQEMKIELERAVSSIYLENILTEDKAEISVIEFKDIPEWTGDKLSLEMDIETKITGITEGYSLMSFQVPIYLYSNDPATTDGTEPKLWYLRGGAQNKLPDAGIYSLGGAILIGTYISVSNP